MTILVGQMYQSRQAFGRVDAFVFTVRGVTERGVYVNSPESRSPGNLYSLDDFSRLFRLVG